MIAEKHVDVAIVGGGPAGLAAALEAAHNGAETLLIEREARLGGILKQCIHDGFGVVRFHEKLSGPEYAQRFVEEVKRAPIEVMTLTFVTHIMHTDTECVLTLTGREGLIYVHTRALILATGCRERTSRQIGVHGRHAAGVFTAGQTQHYTNILGLMPTRRCVVLGSGDIGLIMARRLTLEGAKVIGVYEAKPTVSGLMRNVYQCLTDFDIPLHTGMTVTRLFGDARLEAVEVSKVDDAMRPIPGAQERIACDALILSVGLIPENELAESLSLPLDAHTKGPAVDQNNRTLLPNVFICGNALYVNDLVDYVSESGEIAGRAAAKMAASGPFCAIHASGDFLSTVPQRVDLSALSAPVTLFFKSRAERAASLLTVHAGEQLLFQKRYSHLRPPEMERVQLDLANKGLTAETEITLALTEVQA